MTAGVLVDDRGVGRPLGRLPDEHRPGLCGALDAGGRVHDVARDHPLALRAKRHGRLTGQHARAGLEVGRVRLGAQRLDGRDEFEGSANGAFNELWWFYPSASSSECDRYVIWNYVNNWWAIGSLARSAMADAAVFSVPIAAASDLFIYQHETGWLDGVASRVGNVWAETGAISLAAGDKTIDIMQAELDGGANYNATKLRAYGRQYRQGAERSFGPYVPRSNGLTDMRVQGRDIRLRFEAARDEDWSIGAVRLDVMPGAER